MSVPLVLTSAQPRTCWLPARGGRQVIFSISPMALGFLFLPSPMAPVLPLVAHGAPPLPGFSSSASSPFSSAAPAPSVHPWLRVVLLHGCARCSLPCFSLSLDARATTSPVATPPWNSQLVLTIAIAYASTLASPSCVLCASESALVRPAIPPPAP
uniref:Uncharacterized protein n=1 Tax=Zea mays TaxID=4577 RepID=A0A804MI14_MAIZE